MYHTAPSLLTRSFHKSKEQRTMDASTNGQQGRPVKRRKLAGTTSYGTAPTEFTGYGKETMVFIIHNFAYLQEKREECIKTLKPRKFEHTVINGR